MKRWDFEPGWMTACFCLALTAPLLAAQPATDQHRKPSVFKRSERLGHQARREVLGRSARLRQSYGEGWLLAGRIWLWGTDTR